MKRLTASVVGGGQGGRLSMAALAASDRYELKAAADLRPEAREQLRELYPGMQTFSSHEEMFAQCPTDIVCISTFPPSHEEVTMDAMALPIRGILVEKPLGHTVESGRRILEAVKKRGLPIAVPHGLVAKATPIEVIERVQRGEIGELRLVEIQNNKWDIINAGIHWLHFFVTLTGNEPAAFVMAQCDTSTRTYRDGMQVETAAITYVQTRSGIRAVMMTGDDVLVNREGKETLFRIVGTHGQIEFWGWENGYWIQNADHPAGAMVTPAEYEVTGHRRHLERMADQIEAGQNDYRIADSSLTALERVESAYLSARIGCRVSFPIESFREPDARGEWIAGIPYAGVGGGRNGRML